LEKGVTKITDANRKPQQPKSVVTIFFGDEGREKNERFNSDQPKMKEHEQ
jgi:hypothetical protein